MKYKGLLLDLDDTLIKSAKIYDKAMLYTAKYAANKYGLDEKKFFNTVMDRYAIISRSFPTTHTRHSRILVYRDAFESLGVEYDISLLPEFEDMYWDYFLKNIEVYDEVYETLDNLKNHGIKTAIVSDGDLALRIRKTTSAGLLPYIDEIVASEEVIFEKPFSAIFTLALSRLGIEPHEAIMVGNNYKNDIRGAQLVGIRSGMFDPAVDGNPIGQDSQDIIVPDFVFNTYSELLKEFNI